MRIDPPGLKIAAEFVAKVNAKEFSGTFAYWIILMGDGRGNEIIMPSGRPLRYVLKYGAFKDPEEVRQHVIAHYCRGGIDPENAIQPLKIWASKEDPGPRTMVPANYTQFGTDRQRAETDAGLRPHSDFLQPPIQFQEKPLIIPIRGSGLTPFRRVRR